LSIGGHFLFPRGPALRRLVAKASGATRRLSQVASVNKAKYACSRLAPPPRLHTRYHHHRQRLAEPYSLQHQSVGDPATNGTAPMSASENGGRRHISQDTSSAPAASSSFPSLLGYIFRAAEGPLLSGPMTPERQQVRFREPSA
jgi:hypothetical protein